MGYVTALTREDLMQMRNKENERGQLLPLLGFQVFILFALASLAIDVGFWQHEQRAEQSAVDAAAIAGAIEMNYSVAPTDIYRLAALDAAANGYAPNGGSVVLNAHISPTSGPFVGRPDIVEAVLTKQQPVFFALPGFRTQPVTVRALAAYSNPPRNCIVALDPNGSGVNFHGSLISIPQCGVASNGQMDLSGSTVDAQSIMAVGSLTTNGSRFPNAQPIRGSAVADPCLTLSGCAYLQSHKPDTTTCISVNASGSGNITLYPGVYCGGMNFSGANVTFTPGVYVLTGSNGIKAAGSTLNGSGVTFYMDGGSLDLTGATVNLQAPVSGLTEGVLFFQPKYNVSETKFAGTAGSNVMGALYAPGSSVRVNGSVSDWLLIVGASVVSGGVNITVSGKTFPGSRHATLAL